MMAMEWAATATVPSLAINEVNTTCPRQAVTRSPAIGVPTATHWRITGPSSRLSIADSCKTGWRITAQNIKLPPTTYETAVAIAAPNTPSPAGPIKRKFKKIFSAFMMVLKIIGVRVLPVARSTEAIKMLLLRNSIGSDTTPKYREALRRISLSAPSQAGKNGAMANVTTPSPTPKNTISQMAWMPALRAVSRSPLPSAREITDSTPMPKAKSGAFTSHIMEVVSPTEADACAPMAPTCAVSAYDTTVCSACSTTVGQARCNMVRIRSPSPSISRKLRHSLIAKSPLSPFSFVMIPLPTPGPQEGKEKARHRHALIYFRRSRI